MNAQPLCGARQLGRFHQLRLRRHSAFFTFRTQTKVARFAGNRGPSNGVDEEEDFQKEASCRFDCGIIAVVLVALITALRGSWSHSRSVRGLALSVSLSRGNATDRKSRAEWAVASWSYDPRGFSCQQLQVRPPSPVLA